MSRRLAALLLAVVAMLAAASSARADWHEPGEENITGHPLIQRMLDAGQGWWSKQGVYVTGRRQGMTVYSAPGLFDRGAEGETVGKAMWIDSDTVAWAERGGWSPVADLCLVGWHELAHSPPALMTHEQMVPFEAAKHAGCARFADRVEHDARKARKRS